VDNVTEIMVTRIDPIAQGDRTIVYQPFVSTRNERIQLGNGVRIDAFVKLEGGECLDIGDDVHIASFCHVNIGGGTTILKQGSSMGSGAKTISGGNQPDAKTCSRVAPDSEQVLGAGTIVLEENSCLYAGAMVYAAPNTTVKIGAGSRIGAMSLVTKSVPPGELWAGVPAQFIRKVNV
jgi:acetyltransferase-like isoleucine patch superfamily enzyme